VATSVGNRGGSYQRYLVTKKLVKNKKQERVDQLFPRETVKELVKKTAKKNGRKNSRENEQNTARKYRQGLISRRKKRFPCRSCEGVEVEALL